MSVDLSQFHQVFFEESFENLDAMEAQLMALNPSRPDDETINSIFRAAHSIKGGAGTFGFLEVASFTHILETLLDEIRSGRRTTTQDEIDLHLQSVDCLREMLHACQGNQPIDSKRTKSLEQQFTKLLNLEANDEKTTVGELPTTDDSQSITRLWSINFYPEENLLGNGNEPLRMFRVLSDLGKLEVTCSWDSLPAFENIVPEHCYLSWQLTLESSAERNQIDEVFEWVADQAKIEINSEEVQAVDNKGSANYQNTANNWLIEFKPHKHILVSGNDPLRLIRELCQLGDSTVDVNTPSFPEFASYNPEECSLSWRINLQSDCDEKTIRQVFEWVEDESDLNILNQSLLPNQDNNNLKQELADIDAVVADSNAQNIIKAETGNAKQPAPKTESSSIRVAIDKIDNLINMVGELVITQSMLGQIGGDFEMEKLPRLLEGLSQLEHNTRELQESVMRIRMLPISFAFSRFPRMVRDLSRRLDRQIELVLIGEQTELDKTVMEKIGDPLVHLVRNAIDHGIESPEERRKVGKNPQGTITLNAYHQSGNVVIEIQDDGKGLDKSKLLEKAKLQGIVSASDIASINDNQIFDLIFHPGLSTAAEVSDVSGRGVGMDVVKKNIQELNGSVDIRSQSKVGTTITIRLPLTLAILDGQLVRVGGHIYIFPLVSIVESMQVKNEDLNHVAGGCDLFQLRDEYIPVVRLYELFGVKPDTTNIEESLLVVVEADGHKTGVVVDELSSQQQVVIKSLEQNYQRVEGVSGATILGDGTVSLILDIPGLVHIAGAQHLNHIARGGHKGIGNYSQQAQIIN